MPTLSLLVLMLFLESGGIWGIPPGSAQSKTRAFIASLSDGGGIQIVVVADAKIVGWCDVTPVPFEGMRHVGRLGMGLLPSFRGQGLGRRLVREALGQVFAKTHSASNWRYLLQTSRCWTLRARGICD